MIESKVEAKVSVQSEYPCLLRYKSTGEVVLATAPAQGVVVVQGMLPDGSKLDPVGTYSTSWSFVVSPDRWELLPPTETVVLSNA